MTYDNIINKNNEIIILKRNNFDLHMCHICQTTDIDQSVI